MPLNEHMVHTRPASFFFWLYEGDVGIKAPILTEVWSRFWSWILINLRYDYKQLLWRQYLTLGSVVPLAIFHLWLWFRLLTNWTLKQRAWCKSQVAFVVILKSRLPPMHIWGWKLQQWAWCIETHSLNNCFNWKDFAGKALWLNGLPGLRWGASAVALAAISNPLWFIASTALCLYEGGLHV